MAASCALRASLICSLVLLSRRGCGIGSSRGGRDRRAEFPSHAAQSDAGAPWKASAGGDAGCVRRPVIVLLPLKFLAVWLMAQRAMVAAFACSCSRSSPGLGMTAFIFEVTRPKLLQMAWFRLALRA